MVYVRIGCDVVYQGYKVRKVGAQYEITHFLYDVERRSGESSGASSAVCCGVGERDISNLIRAKRRVYELCACNSWDYFCTFTLRSSYDRFNLAQWRKDFSQWLRNVRKLTGCDVKYVLVPEQHMNGCWHMHGMFFGLPSNEISAFVSSDIGDLNTPDIVKQMKADFLNRRGYLCWRRYNKKWGFCSLAPVRNAQACARYVSKYISKDMLGGALDSGAHMYYASQGLKVGETVDFGALVGDWDSSGLYHFCNDYIERWTTDDIHRLPILCRIALERDTLVNNLGNDNGDNFVSPLEW